MNWNELGNEIIELNNYYHSKKLKLSMKDRLKDLVRDFRKILEMVEVDNKKALEYVKRRKPEDIKLGKIQKNVNNEMKKKLNLPDIIPVSSYTAGTNLLGISDLDFAVLVDDLNTEKLLKYSNILGLNGYKFTEIRQPGVGVHYVFEKYEDNVEIEMKLRDKKYFMDVIYPMHLFIDKKISKKDKILITWIKHNLKKNSKEGYKAFKVLYYEYGVAMAGLKDMLYPIN